MAAVIADPGGDLPAARDVDYGAFWPRFTATAPWPLAHGFRVATWVIAIALPRLLGHRSGLAGLGPDEAEAVIQRATRLPGVASLTEVAKIVACFAYFSDPRVDAAIRGDR